MLTPLAEQNPKKPRMKRVITDRSPVQDLDLSQHLLHLLLGLPGGLCPERAILSERNRANSAHSHRLPS